VDFEKVEKQAHECQQGKEENKDDDDDHRDNIGIEFTVNHLDDGHKYFLADKILCFLAGNLV